MTDPNKFNSTGEETNSQPTGWEEVAALANKPFIKPETRQQVEMREFVPPTRHGNNLGRHLVEISIRLENENLTDAEREKLEAEQTEWVQNTRNLLKFISEDGFTKTPPGIDAFRLCEKMLPAMDNYYMDKTKSDTGFLSAVEQEFRNNNGGKAMGWKTESAAICDYPKMLSVKKEDGSFMVSDETLIDFVRGYNFVIAQKNKELEQIRPQILSNFADGVRKGVDAGVLPNAALERLQRMEEEIGTFIFGDPIERASSGYPNGKNRKNISTDQFGNMRTTNNLEFFTYDRPLGHIPYHELMHLLEGDLVRLMFGKSFNGADIHEAMTESLTLSLFNNDESGDLGVATVKDTPTLEDELTGNAYIEDRRILQSVLTNSKQPQQLRNELYNDYFISARDLSEQELVEKRSKINALLA